MAVQSYSIDPDRVGLSLTQGEALPYNDEGGRQRHDDAGMPMWQVPTLLADVDVELRIRFGAQHQPTLDLNSPVRLDGETRVSTFAGRIAGSQRASLTMRTERLFPDSPADDDLFGGGDHGLYLVDTGTLTVVAAERIEARYPRTGDWCRFRVVRGWRSTDGALNGMERWSIDVKGRSFSGVKRMSAVEFGALRVNTFLNADRTSARLDLEASDIRTVQGTPEPTPTHNRARREPVSVAAESNGETPAEG